MRSKWRLIFMFCIGYLSFITPLSAQTHLGYYESDDWQTWTNQRHITVIARDVDVMYFATTNGLIIYDENRDDWEFFWLPKRPFRIGVGAFWLYLEVATNTRDQSVSPFIWFDKIRREWKYGYDPQEEVTWYEPLYNMPELTRKYPFVHGVDFMDDFLRNYEITSAQENYLGDVLWIGTNGDGIYQYDIDTGWISKKHQGLLDNSVPSMIKTDRTIWFGGAGEKNQQYRGLTLYHEDTDEFQFIEAHYIRQVPTATVVDFCRHWSDLWLATPEGLVRFNSNTKSWQVFTVHKGLTDNNITAVIAILDEIWVGTAHGLNWIVVDSHGHVDEIGPTFNDKLAHLPVLDLETDGNTAWAATIDGAYTYTYGDSTWRQIDDPNGWVAAGEITAVSLDEDFLYFGTTDGLIEYDRLLDNWERLLFFHTLPEVNAYGNLDVAFDNPPRISQIVADKFNIWVATDKGVWRYLKRIATWHKYVAWDTIINQPSPDITVGGLVDNKVNDVLIDGDYVWFATDKGATKFRWNDRLRTW